MAEWFFKHAAVLQKVKSSNPANEFEFSARKSSLYCPRNREGEQCKVSDGDKLKQVATLTSHSPMVSIGFGTYLNL